MSRQGSPKRWECLAPRMDHCLLLSAHDWFSIEHKKLDSWRISGKKSRGRITMSLSVQTPSRKSDSGVDMHKDFADWYRLIDVEPTDAILQKRWAGVRTAADDLNSG